MNKLVEIVNISKELYNLLQGELEWGQYMSIAEDNLFARWRIKDPSMRIAIMALLVKKLKEDGWNVSCGDGKLTFSGKKGAKVIPMQNNLAHYHLVGTLMNIGKGYKRDDR